MNSTRNDVSVAAARPVTKLMGLTWLSIILVVVGALNWGLVGLFKFDLVAAIFGHLTIVSRIVYVLVALAGIYLIVDAGRLREDRGSGRAATV